jgi:hypothetical protein
MNTKVLDRMRVLNASNNSSQVSHQGAPGGLFIEEFKSHHYNVGNAPVQPLHPNTLQSWGLVVRLCSWHHCLAQRCLLNTELTLLVISTLRPHALGERSFYCCLIKNLTPLRASPVRKRVQALNVIVRCYYYYEGSFIIHETFVFYKLDLDE